MKKFGHWEGVPTLPDPTVGKLATYPWPVLGPVPRSRCLAFVVGCVKLVMMILPTVIGCRHVLNKNHQHKFCWVNLKMMVSFWMKKMSGASCYTFRGASTQKCSRVLRLPITKKDRTMRNICTNWTLLHPQISNAVLFFHALRRAFVSSTCSITTYYVHQGMHLQLGVGSFE